MSNTVMFEYKRPASQEGLALKEPKTEENDNLLKFTLLQRLENVDMRLEIKQEPVSSDMVSACEGAVRSVEQKGPMVRLDLPMALY